MTTALGDLARMENIIRGSDVRPVSGGRIIFHPNMATNGPMWHYWMII